METKETDTKKRIILIIGFLVLLSPIILACGLIVLTGTVFFIDGFMQTVTWREHTIPLSQEVLDDLCNKFELGPEDERCDDSGGDVYGPDFYDLLYKSFTPKDQPWATFEEVNEIVGNYQYKCEPPVIFSEGESYYRCFYDFSGDKVYPFVIYYYIDGPVMRIIADVVD
jgi:hypothetical protein